MSSLMDSEMSMKSSVEMVLKDMPRTGATEVTVSPSYMQGVTYRPQSAALF